MRLILVLLISSIAILTILPGCGGGGLEVTMPMNRGISLRAGIPDASVGQTQIQGAAPLLVLYLPQVDFMASDIGNANAVQSVQIDHGDGAGWIDVTSEWRAYLQLVAAGGEIVAERDYIQHKYKMQGHFEMRARVEFSDGEIHYTGAEDAVFPQPRIKVMPYEVDTIVDFKDPHDGREYQILDGRLIIAFKEPLDRAAADQFILDMELEVVNEWWMVSGIGAALPAKYSVLEAVRDWAALYPEVIAEVVPDEVTLYD